MRSKAKNCIGFEEKRIDEENEDPHNCVFSFTSL